MFTRSLAILLAPLLPMSALIFPMGTLHRVDDLVAGTIVTILSAFALGNDRARVGGAVVAGWVALAALVFPSSLLEEVLALSWGTLMFAWLAGPFSAPPRVTREPAAAPAETATAGGQLPLAA
ncbi:MAG TPA: hypothetical protein VMT03_13705 [Polyangia bacterium]|nr:hypothetical protein [Polyangia bacterium]